MCHRGIRNRTAVSFALTYIGQYNALVAPIELPLPPVQLAAVPSSAHPPTPPIRACRKTANVCAVQEPSCYTGSFHMRCFRIFNISAEHKRDDPKLLLFRVYVANPEHGLPAPVDTVGGL